jgi:hypothetical protein
LPAWLGQAVARAVAVAPEERFGDVIEFIFALEHGSIDAAAARPRRAPLYERNPLLFWQLASVALALTLLGKCALG